jgi:hypothetical protein
VLTADPSSSAPPLVPSRLNRGANVQSPTNHRTTETLATGTFAKGYAISALIAVVVAIGGGPFEAVTGWVTFTLMPDVVFVLCNAAYLASIRKVNEKRGAEVGFLNLILVIIISVITFVMAGGINHIG